MKKRKSTRVLMIILSVIMALSLLAAAGFGICYSLVEKRLIYTEPTTVTLKDGTKRNGSLLYTIRPIQEAKDYYVEQQAKANEKSRLMVQKKPAPL